MITREFRTSHHFPAHMPDRRELNAMGAEGWRIVSTAVTPPQSQYAVHGLLILWSRHTHANDGAVFGEARG